MPVKVREDLEELVERLAREFDRRRQSNTGEDRSKALQVILSSSEEYLHGTPEFREELAGLVYDRQIELFCERFCARGHEAADIRPTVKYNGWLDEFENRRAS